MANRYLFWLRTTAVLQIITACIHAMGFFRKDDIGLALMSTPRHDLGPYFHPTQNDIFVGLSACFSFLYLLGGMTTLFLLQKNLAPPTWKGLTSINLLVFGGAFAVMLMFTFLAPIILTGLVFIGLSFAYATNHIHKIRLPKE